MEKVNNQRQVQVASSQRSITEEPPDGERICAEDQTADNVQTISDYEAALMAVVALARKYTLPGPDGSCFEEVMVYCERTRETDNCSMAMNCSNSSSDIRSKNYQPVTAVDPLKELQRLRLKLATQLEAIAASGRLISDASRSITKRMQNVSTKMDQLNSDIQQLVPDD